MPETPYCPLLSINKDVPVLCQEELCMWYVKQLKLCSITVLAYTNALNLQTLTPSGAPSLQKPQMPTQDQQSLKQTTSKNESSKAQSQFTLDDLD